MDAASRSRRRGHTSTASSSGRGCCNNCTGRSPRSRASQQLSLWFFLLLAVIAFSVVGRACGRPRGSHVAAGAHLLVVSLFSLGIVPASAATRRLGALRVGELRSVRLSARRALRLRPPRRCRACSIRQLALGAGAVALAIVLLVLPAFTTTRYADYSLQTFGVHRHSYEIEHDGRTFYYGKKDRADAANLVIAAAARISKPGQRLFVGPGDLRKTPYSDAYLYYELGDLVPATYYIEMDPGVANTADSGLDRQLASADIVILSKIWDNWSEPNDSRKVGSDKAERVLARDFCHVGTYLDLYELYRKCQ